MTTPVTRVRFAPSPTGNLHLGSARTALFCWLFAKNTGGEYIVRLEDTDRQRSTKESEEQILRTLSWLGLREDAKAPENVRLIRQSERGPLYTNAINHLFETGFLYPCTESTPDAAGRLPLRGRIEGSIDFDDLVHGPRHFHGDNINDPIMVRSNGSATYNLACAIDDLDTQITHVIRGEDHLSNTPAQVAAMHALGATAIPIYAHLPMILGKDGLKLSKRHGAVSVEDYYDDLPESVLNYLALLGWAPKRENKNSVYAVDELIEQFDISRVGKSPAQFDDAKYHHLQGIHMRKLGTDKAKWSACFDNWNADRVGVDGDTAHYLAHDKAARWSDVAELVRPAIVGDNELTYDDEITFAPEGVRHILRSAHIALSELDTWDEKGIGECLRQMCADLSEKPRDVIPFVQHAVMGKVRGTSVFRVIDLLGKERTLLRLKRALKV